MESQLALEKEREELVDIFSDALPDLILSEVEMADKVYGEGVLSAKFKRLIALAIALRAECANCILHQTLAALDAGATKEEILETISVEVAMSGTTGIAESLRVIKLLNEMGKL